MINSDSDANRSADCLPQELEAKDEQFVRCRGSQWSLSGVDAGIWWDLEKGLGIFEVQSSWFHEEKMWDFNGLQISK